jgi:hypothetical protein
MPRKEAIQELELYLMRCCAAVLQVLWFVEAGKDESSISTSPFGLAIGWHRILVIFGEF